MVTLPNIFHYFLNDLDYGAMTLTRFYIFKWKIPFFIEKNIHGFKTLSF